MNWQHIVPRNQDGKHDLSWPEDGQSKCQCKPKVDFDKRSVIHRPIHDK